MTSSITISKEISPDSKHWYINASIVPGGSLPLDIFAYENNGTATLGQYIGVCSLEEYQRLLTFANSPVPVFGNRFLKSIEAKIQIDAASDPTLVINHLISGVKSLSLSIANAETYVQVVNIP